MLGQQGIRLVDEQDGIGVLFRRMSYTIPARGCPAMPICLASESTFFARDGMAWAPTVLSGREASTHDASLRCSELEGFVSFFGANHQSQHVGLQCLGLNAGRW